jgi:phage-related protein
MDSAKKSVRGFKEVGKDLKQAGQALSIGLTAPILGFTTAALLSASKTNEKTKEVMDKLSSAMDKTLAHLGTAITPLFEKLVDQVIIPMLDGINDLIDAYEKLPAPVQEVIGVAILLLAALGPVLLVIGQIMTTVAALTPVFTALGGALGGVALGPVALLVAAIIGLVAAFLWLYDNVAWFRKAVNDNIDALVWEVRVGFDSITSLLGIFGALLNGDLTGAIKIFAGFWQRTFESMPQPIKQVFDSVMSYMYGLFDVARSIINGLIDMYNKIPTVTDIPTIPTPGDNAFWQLPSDSTPGKYYKGRASGGPVDAGETYVVGENGPELLSMGRNSGTVIPNGGQPVTIQIIMDGRITAQGVAPYLSKVTRVSVGGAR